MPLEQHDQVALGPAEGDVARPDGTDAERVIQSQLDILGALPTKTSVDVSVAPPLAAWPAPASAKTPASASADER